MADLLYTELEEELRTTVRALLAERSPASAILARCETEAPYDMTGLWHGLAIEIGCAGLAIPEKFGGAGASWREVAVVAEELGRAAAPTPFLGSAVLATAALNAMLLVPEAEELLAGLADVRLTGTLVVPLSTAPETDFPDAVSADGSGRLTGTVANVADAFTELLLVPALGPDGPGLYAVDASADGLVRDVVTSLDLTRPLADVTFDAAPARLLVSGEAAATALTYALGVGAAILAAEQLGIAEGCLELTVGYLKTRYQFGRLIGSYQALKHRAADLWAAVTQARAVARYAADCIATGDADTPVAIALAQAYCSGVAVRAAEECVQLHGGIGFTWEHPAHLYLKRAKADSIALGTARRHRSRLAELVEL